jgi:peptidoglycan/xylan/chitin deacetylase (PgdA/CDA1 family)
MDKQYLTTHNYIIGRINTIREGFYPKEIIEDINTKDFRLIKNMNAFADKGKNNSVNVYTGSKKEKYVMKSLSFRFKNLKYQQMINEASLLELLDKLNKNGTSDISFPKLISLEKKHNRMTLIREYLKGKRLSDFSPSVKINVLNRCILLLKKLSFKLSKEEQRALPKRNKILLFIMFHFYFVHLLLTKKTKLNYKKIFSVYVKHFLTSSVFKKSIYILSHRDLDIHNILVDKNIINIIDPEVMTLAEPETDLAIVSRLYSDKVTKGQLLKLITDNVHDIPQFIRLSLFYTLQLLSQENKEDEYFIQAEKYIPLLFDFIIPNLVTDKKINLTYTIRKYLLILVKKINQNRYISSGKLNAILCYHSVENDDWDFSVDKKVFEQQIKLLNKKYSVVTLSELLKSKNSENKIAITFDDGYQNLYKNALPILKKYRIKPTVFIIGNTKDANRYELENNKKLLTREQIKKLKLLGWEFGYHTETHSNLLLFNKEGLTNEIITSKNAVEKELGFKIKYFAYPMGDYNQEIVTVVQKGKYKSAFTINSGSFNHKGNHLKHTRIQIDRQLSLEQFETLITPLGIVIDKYITLIVRLKDKISLLFANKIDNRNNNTKSFVINKSN